MVWLIAALWERAKVVDDPMHELFLVKVLFIYPLVAVITVDAIFYAAAFWRTQAKEGDVGVPSDI